MEPAKRDCTNCKGPIAPGRLEALPSTFYCVRCAAGLKLPDPDANVLCAAASSSGRNGFARND